MGDRKMKKIIIGIILGMILTSLGGCFIPYHDDGRRSRGHGWERDGRIPDGDIDWRMEPKY
jgi:hypothetical protein